MNVDSIKKEIDFNEVHEEIREIRIPFFIEKLNEYGTPHYSDVELNPNETISINWSKEFCDIFVELGKDTFTYYFILQDSDEYMNFVNYSDVNLKHFSKKVIQNFKVDKNKN